MPGSVAAELKVEEILDAYIQSAQYEKNQVNVAGKTYGALDLDEDDYRVFREELVVLSRRVYNPAIADCIARGAPRLLDAVRMVNDQSKQGFKGASSRGDQLIINPMRVGDVSRTTWLVTVSAAGAANWLGATGAANDIDMLVSSLPVISHIFLGFIDPVASPKIDRVQLVKDSDPYVEEVLDFGWSAIFGDGQTPFHELKTPWIVPPGSSYYMPVSYFITGEDRLQPVAYAVKRARDVIAALA